MKTTIEILTVLALAFGAVSTSGVLQGQRAERSAERHIAAQDGAAAAADRQDGPAAAGESRWPRGSEQPPPRRGGEASSDRRPDSRSDPRSRWREYELTPEDRELIIEVISDLRPLTEENAQQLREMSASDFRNQVLQRAGRLIFLAGLKKNEPRLYELKVEELKVGEEIDQTLRRYREAASQASNATPPPPDVRERLVRLVARQHDLRILTREAEIEMLEERIADMRQSLERDRIEKDQRVEARVGELLSREPAHRGNQPGPGDAPGSGSPPGAGRDIGDR